MFATITMATTLIILIILHEVGHMIAARSVNVGIQEFGLGLPPKIYAKKIGQTNVTLNLIPLGGFVRLMGNQPYDTHGYMSATMLSKIWILIGGVVANFIIAWILLTIALWMGLSPLGISETPSTSMLIPSKSYATSQGWVVPNPSTQVTIQALDPEGILTNNTSIQTGDILISINGQDVTSTNLVDILNTINSNVTIQRLALDTNTINVDIIECLSPCRLGIAIDPPYTLTPIINHRYQAPRYALREIPIQGQLTLNALSDIVSSLGSSQTDTQQAFESLSGPVGVVAIGSSIIHTHQRQIFIVFTALISLALGWFNLLPIPALDGGRILGVIIQKTFAISAQRYYHIESIINTLSFGLLMILGILIIILDITKLL